MSKLSKYFKGVVKEGKRVRWPKKHDLWSSIAVVVCVALFAAICLALSDLITAELLGQLEDSFSSLRG
jgi:preprotein translocase SecE subunit